MKLVAESVCTRVDDEARGRLERVVTQIYEAFQRKYRT
jgi:hypothetical protein